MATTVDGDINVFDYTVQEDATPLNPGDVNGGYGQLTYTISQQENSERRFDTPTELLDTSKGSYDAVVSNMEANNGFISVTANSALSQLSRWYSVLPFEGKLSDYLAYIKELVGLDRNIVAEASIASRVIQANGYVGNVWEGLKQLLSANQLEVVQDLDRFLVRKNQSHSVVPENITSDGWALTNNESAEKITVSWYETVGWETKVAVFPPIDDEPFEPLSVEANEILEQEITLNASIVSINQPTVIDYVAANTIVDNTNGVYCVSGSDGKPIDASRWKASGGWLRVELTDNPSVIKIVVRGGSVEEYAPYRIAATAGTSSYYNSLHLTGTGFRWTEQEITMSTGAKKSETEEGTPAEVTNINLLNRGQAYTAALRAARALNGGDKFRSGSAEKWNQPQAFGLPVGARVEGEHAFYRVKNQEVHPSNVGYTLEIDTTMDDFNNRMGALSMAQFSTLYNGYRMVDFGSRPLQ